MKPEEIEKIVKDNESLSTQVMRLLRTEYDLYNTQLTLDTQLSLYRKLYETGKTISAMKDFSEVFAEMGSFILESLNYGGYILLERKTKTFEAINSGGFCTEYLHGARQSLPVTKDDSRPMGNIEGFFTTETNISPIQLEKIKKLCPFDTFVAHFLCLGKERDPMYLLIVGNPAEQEFFSEIKLESGHMVSLGNLISFVETVLNNQLYYQQLNEERESLEIKVKQRTEELNKAMEDLKVLNDKLEVYSFQDELTGLYNRRAFFIFGEKFLSMAKRKGKNILVLYCDLDRFKPINDMYGHKEGDLALQATADILKNACRDYDIVSRFGGDEFVILFDDFSADAFDSFLIRFEKLFNDYNQNSNKEYDIHISYGYTVYSPSKDKGISLDKLIERADRKLYCQKRKKKNEDCNEDNSRNSR